MTRLIRTLTGENGCPWDKKQTPENMAAYLLEESHEVFEAVAQNDPDHVCEELGDVLFHIVFIALLYQKQGSFRLSGVISRICEKMVRRHPHVFGDVHIENDQQVKEQWQQIKNREKAGNKDASLLNNIPAALPAVMRALAMSQKAARVGFDWPDVRGVVDKMEEEWAEFKDELKAAPAPSGDNPGLMEEIGDLMFTLVNLARLLDIHPESALARANAKFQSRFGQMENLAHGRGETLEDMDFAEMDRLWDKAKAMEKQGSSATP